MKTYTIDIEMFDTPVEAGPCGWRFQSVQMEQRKVVGYRAAVEVAKTEAAVGKLGRCVVLRDAGGRGREF